MEPSSKNKIARNEKADRFDRFFIVFAIKKDTKSLRIRIFQMAGVLGFEPRKCQIQSLVPYRLAIPQCFCLLNIHPYSPKYKVKKNSFYESRKSFLLIQHLNRTGTSEARCA